LLSCQTRRAPRCPHSFPTRRSSDLGCMIAPSAAPMADHIGKALIAIGEMNVAAATQPSAPAAAPAASHFGLRRRRSGKSDTMRRSEEHTSELQSRENLVCRLLLEKK